MTRFIYTFWLGLLFILLFSDFQCENEHCEYYFLLRDWQPTWLDNRGGQPQPTQGPVPRLALGIRLSARHFAADSFQNSAIESCQWLALHPISQLKIFATDGFDTVAFGEDISRRFSLRANPAYGLRYLALEEAGGALNYFSVPFDGDYYLDLLMLEPPSQPGAYRFSVQIRFDSLALPLNRDTSFTSQPTVT